MTNIDNKIRVPKIYRITGLTAYTYAGLLLVYSVYYQFFYIDQTILHTAITFGFAVLSGLLWIGILLVTKRFLSEVLNFNKASSLITFYLVFLGVYTLSIIKGIANTLSMLSALEDIQSFDSFPEIATTTILSVVLLFASNFAMAIIGIFLGVRIGKIDKVAKMLFKILGFAFIAHGICTILIMITIIEFDAVGLLLKAVLVLVLGLILNKVYAMDASDLFSLVGAKPVRVVQPPPPKPQAKVAAKPILKPNNKPIGKVRKPSKKEKRETKLEPIEIPTLDVNSLGNKDEVLSYFEKLPKHELSRLALIVSNNYSQPLTDAQRTNLVIQHIVQHKLYDHQRYAP